MLMALPLLRKLGFHRQEIYGFDSCLDVEGNHHAYKQDENNYEKVLSVSCGGKIFNCHAWMASQAQEAIDLFKLLINDVDLAVHGDGLIAHIIQTGADMNTEEAAPQEMDVGQA